jgi:hypothetical protein
MMMAGFALCAPLAAQTCALSSVYLNVFQFYSQTTAAAPTTPG